MAKSETHQSIAIVLTDIVDLQTIMRTNEDHARALLKQQRDLINPVLERHDGTMFIAHNFETMLMFGDARQAVECAIDIQQTVSNSNDDLTFRMGIHVEDLAAGEGRISDTGVKIASEILNFTPPAGIYLTENAHRHLMDISEVKSHPVGKKVVKWTPNPVEIYQIDYKPAVDRNRRPRDISLFKDIWNRRVPHILGLYLGSSWGILEFTGSLLVDRFGYPEMILDIVMVALATFIPGVLMIAYYHGRPGPDRWMPVEKVWIPVNIVLAAILVFFLFFY